MLYYSLFSVKYQSAVSQSSTEAATIPTAAITMTKICGHTITPTSTPPSTKNVVCVMPLRSVQMYNATQ